jgi:hypothetical protein
VPRSLTVGDLLHQLRDLDPTLQVRLAVNPDWPFTHHLGQYAAIHDGTVYLADDGQQDHLPPQVREALNWT